MSDKLTPDTLEGRSLHLRLWGALDDHIKAWRGDLVQLAASQERVRELEAREVELRPFLRHTVSCARFVQYSNAVPCDCGLDALLAAPEPPGEGQG